MAMVMAMMADDDDHHRGILLGWAAIAFQRHVGLTPRK